MWKMNPEDSQMFSHQISNYKNLESEPLSIICGNITKMGWSSVHMDNNDDIYGIIMGTPEFVNRYADAPLCHQGNEVPQELTSDLLYAKLLEKFTVDEISGLTEPFIQIICGSLEIGWTEFRYSSDGLVVGTPEFVELKCSKNGN
jgi:hypothetical protein